MIKVPFDPERLEGQERGWWNGWSAKADRKMLEYIEKRNLGKECELDSSVWSELKVWLLETVFHGKCAYCEVQVTAGSFGDAEHYRPKGNVTMHDGVRKRQVQLPTGSAHGGYYWLAYDWRNLLPACTRCNNNKSDQFEVAGDYVGTPSPDTQTLNATEQPLLLYPYHDEPFQFLRFGKAGVVTAIDGNPRGMATIRMLGLDRRELMEERWREQSRALEAMENRVGRLLTDDAGIGDRAQEYMGPKAPFSRAVHDWFVERVRLVSIRAQKAAEDAQRR